MSGLSRTPSITKGAIIGFDLFNPVASVVIFGYNPTTVSRTLQARAAGRGGSRSEVLRLTGPPNETIRLKVRIDASDQLETNDPIATSVGIYPQLAALEMLLYPKSAHVIANAALAAGGSLEILPPTAPFTLFVWGLQRVVPVRVEQFSIEEQQFDQALNPIRADVDLSLQVLSTADFALTHPGWATYLAHQIVKEAMAVIGSASNLSKLPSLLP
jgi:hypothetical protein